MTTNQHTPGTPERVSYLLDEADYYLDADTGWKGKLSGAERLARRNSDIAAAQANATLAVATAIGGLTEAVTAGLGEAEALRSTLEAALAEIRDGLTGDGHPLDRIERTLDAGLSGINGLLGNLS